ncbi:MAG: erythromycin esterase family protein [Polyangiaceae bacterium]|nr:erythromycin esterase family protein [Polyangiaceae bacterium]
MNRRSLLASLLVAWSLFGSGCSGPEPAETQEPEPTTVSEWAAMDGVTIDAIEEASQSAALDQAFSGLSARDPKIIGVGEGAHGMYEYTALRTEMFRYLVEKQGVKALVPETGVVEARIVDLYVQGDDALSIDEVMEKGWTHYMGQSAEARRLVEWMRAYNEGKAEADRIHFLGKDLPALGDTLTVPLAPLAAYLAEVDPEYAASDVFQATMALAQQASALTETVNAAWIAQTGQTIDPDYLDAFTTLSFEQLPAADQMALTTGITDVVETFMYKQDSYAAASTRDEAEWNAQLAVVATQILRDLFSRQENPPIYNYAEAVALLEANEITVTSEPAHVLDPTSAEDWRSYFIGRNSREDALAENVALGQGRYGRVMTFAHYGHLTRVPEDVVVVMGMTVEDPGIVAEGNVIAERYGDDYVLAAATTLEYVDEAGAVIEEHALSKFPEAVENDFVEAVTTKLLVLDMDTAPASIAGSLGKRKMRWQFDLQEVDLMANFDYMLVFDAVGPDQP